MYRSGNGGALRACLFSLRVYLFDMKTMCTLLLCVLAVLLAGCETPGQRIARDPELFNAWSPAVQAAVRNGDVRIGFDKDMVTMALGRPSRIYTRTTAQGNSEVWSYVSYKTTPDRQRVQGRFRVRDSSGRYQTVSDSVWVTVDEKQEYERLRIEFTNEIVSAIESLEY